MSLSTAHTPDNEINSVIVTIFKIVKIFLKDSVKDSVNLQLL